MLPPTRPLKFSEPVPLSAMGVKIENEVVLDNAPDPEKFALPVMPDVLAMSNDPAPLNEAAAA